jgi:dihydrofolate synthase/folylpolyglutamate synthase
MALLAFSQVEADVVLLETGLGGRLDATNVVSPALTVMTPIGMDHMDYLGDSIEQIAAEKAGIIKQGVPCVVAKQPRDAVLPVLEQHAAAVDAPLRLVVDSCGVDVSQRQLVGQHQADNACTAITALKQLHTVLPLSHEHLQAGISRAQWAGRMQQLTDGALVNRLPQGAEIWLDGGHNDDAVPAILAQIRHWQSCGKTVRPVVAMRDNKDGAALIQALGLACDVVYVTHIPQHDYSADPHVLAQHVRCAQVIDHLTDCYADANSDTVILSCGSLYFVASVLADNAKG